MNLRTRILIIVVAALIGMVVMAAGGLLQLRQSMYEERESQIAQHLIFAKAKMKYFQAQEAAGKMTREEAQKRAVEVIAAQNTKEDYFIIRALADNMLLSHGDVKRIGKPDAGGKTPDGRPVLEVYKENIAKSQKGVGFITLMAVRPGSGDKTQYKKINGATVFEPWNWMIAYGAFVDDVDSAFWQDAARMLVIGVALIGIVAFLAIRTMRSILGQLGGEPQ
ncbi:Cache domain-containing protein, partial [Formivibrio citricus]